MTFKIDIPQFYDLREPKDGNETNHTFFHGTYSSLTKFFICYKMLKYFNDFYNWHFSIPWQVSANK